MKAIKLKQFQLTIALCALAANVLAASPISICVSNPNDAGDGSLRSAITQANEAGGGEITFSITNTITLLSTLPSLTNITITGPGTNVLTISGNHKVQVFSMNSGTTNTLSGLTIANGMMTNTNNSWPPSFVDDVCGAGISNAGSLMLLNCAILDCTLTSTDNSSGVGDGAGIYNSGDLFMTNCMVADCSIILPGFIYGTTQPENGGWGGGIANVGELIMKDCAVLRCGAANGGGIANGGNSWLIGCMIESCFGVTSFQTVNGAGIYQAGGTLLLQSCIIESCVAGAESVNGVGIFQGGGTIRLQSCVVSGCNGAAVWGGGVMVWAGGGLAATNTTFVGNRADLGGGLFFFGGTNILSGCTINGNFGGMGGGVENYSGTLTMLNCTVSQNGTGGIDGGAYLNHCTIVSNTASGNIQSQDSIFAGNSSSDISGVLTSMGFNLIQDTNGCTITGNQTGNIYGAAPLLGPLQDNGGPTWTHALLPGSPAIDAGSSQGAPAVDQRGIPRPQGLAPDIGAFEFQYATPVLVRMAVQSGTNCSLKLCGLRGGIYTLQASTNLVNWVNVATNMAGTSGVFEFTESGAARCPRRFYRVSLPVPPGAVYIPAPSGILDAPFLITDPYISQPIYTDLTNAGRAEYPFVLSRAGNYMLQAMVNAANASVNSLFVNIDAEPQDPTMIWDVLPYTSGFESRAVNWRGNGTDTSDQIVPIVFTLSQGTHKLIIRGREGWTLLQDMAVVPSSAPYLPATSGLVTAPFIITNDYIYQPTETSVADGGRAAYTFTIPNAGAYVIRAVVNAPNASANSFFVNVDAEPQDPYMVWDIPVTTGFEQREVSWRGNGTFDNNQFVPQVFNLAQGSHQLIIRGREQYTLLRSMTIMQNP
jgi:hypothetical protein